MVVENDKAQQRVEVSEGFHKIIVNTLSRLVVSLPSIGREAQTEGTPC